MAVKGTPRSYYKKFKFLVEIDGIASSKWQSCSRLEAEVGVVTQAEGGTLIDDKSPGRVKFSDLTLSRGSTIARSRRRWPKPATVSRRKISSGTAA